MEIKIRRLLNLTFGCLCITLSLIGIILFSYFKNASNKDNQITITINEETTSNLYVNLKEINPGTERSYLINLDGNDLSLFYISLKFKDNNNTGDLDKYIDVVISANDFSVDKNLHEILINEEKFDLGYNVENISLTYKMDKSIGNEAQNATADFLINLTAKIASK